MRIRAAAPVILLQAGRFFQESMHMLNIFYLSVLTGMSEFIRGNIRMFEMHHYGRKVIFCQSQRAQNVAV